MRGGCTFLKLKYVISLIKKLLLNIHKYKNQIHVPSINAIRSYELILGLIN